MSKAKRKHPSPRAAQRERERARAATGGMHGVGPVPDLGMEEFGVWEEGEEDISEPVHMAVEVEEDLWPDSERTLDDSIYERHYEGEEGGKRRRRRKPTWKGFFKGLLKFLGKVLLWLLIFLVLALIVGTAIIALVNGTPIEEVPANLWSWILHVIYG